jgi:ribosomal protein L37AE/L43A
MAINRIQFQKGLSLSEFLDNYGEESQCEDALEKARWPDGFICPTCKIKNHSVFLRGETKVFQCSRCRTQTTLTGGTIFHSTKLSLIKWFQAMYFMTQAKNNISALELKRKVGIGYKTAWRVKHKLMQVMCEREETTKLSGRVEADDAYLGGENPGGKAGRGSENKIPFIAAVQTDNQGRPLYAMFSPVSTFNLSEVKEWAKRFLVPHCTTVVTDGLACFNDVKEAGCIHEKQVVGKNRKSTDMECFTWVNTILGNLKTAITGTYHAFKFEKYIRRYLAEYQYRFNRRFDLASMLPRLLFVSARTGKRTEAWLRLAEN